MSISSSITRILFTFHLLQTAWVFSITDVLKVKVSGNNYYDETAIRFIQGATQGFDSNWDAHKFFSLNPNVPQVYTRCGITDFAINAFPPLSNDTTIELHLIIPVTGTYTILGIEFGAFLQGTTILLEDLSDGSTYDLLSNSNHSFQMDTASYNAPVRFVIHFDPPVLTSLDSPGKNTDPIIAFIFAGNAISILDATCSAKTIDVLTIDGKLFTQVQSTARETEIELPAMTAGILLVKVELGEHHYCKKLFVK